MSAIKQDVEASKLRRLNSRIEWHILPFLLACYTFANLDKINVGFAKLQMQSNLVFSAAVYGLDAGIFFIGYVLFEIPSNLMMPSIGARKTISRVMILWDLASASVMYVHNETSFYIVCFLLGVFEAGFAPGMIFYLTYWHGASDGGRNAGRPYCWLRWWPALYMGDDTVYGSVRVFWMAVDVCCRRITLRHTWSGFIFLLSDRPQDAKWLSPNGSIRIFLGKAVEQLLSPCLGESVTEHNGKLIHRGFPIEGGTHRLV
ncbi:MFS transporter [Allopusillimonas ginsengisoli]|uniref:MFS transporter n=1 Tax=Allopusillimonas ginsengisoli TaxID=453575 RepID=UPI003CC863B7